MSKIHRLESDSPFGHRPLQTALGMFVLLVVGFSPVRAADRLPPFLRPPVPVHVLNHSGERCRISVNGWTVGELSAGGQTVLLVPIGHIRLHARLLDTNRDWYLAVHEFRPFGWRIAPPPLRPIPPLRVPDRVPVAPAEGSSQDETPPGKADPPVKPVLAHEQSRKVWGGITIEAPGSVRKEAIDEAQRWIRRLLLECPRVRKALVDVGLRVCIYPRDAELTDLPETVRLRGKRTKDGHRYEDVAGLHISGTCIVGESNLLGLAVDSFPRANTLVHEISHAVERFAFDDIQRGRLKQAWKVASERDLWKGTYAAKNRSEYWAELVCCYFGLSDPALARGVKGAYRLKQHDRHGYELVRNVFNGHRRKPTKIASVGLMTSWPGPLSLQREQPENSQ